MTGGAARPEILEAKTISASRRPTPLGTRPRSPFSRGLGHQACGRGRIFPGLCGAHSREATNGSRGEPRLGPGRGTSFFATGAPDHLPHVLHLFYRFAKGRGGLEIVMDTLRCGHTLPVLRPSQKPMAAGGPRPPGPQAWVPATAEAPCARRAHGAVGRGQPSSWVCVKDAGASQERDPSGPLRDQSEGAGKGLRRTKMGPLPGLLFLVSLSLRNSPRRLLTLQGQQRRAAERGTDGPPGEPSAA